MKAKSSLLCFLALWLLLASQAFPAENNAATTLILVRHAEKASDGSNDPVLTPAGVKRAEDLAFVLGLVDLHAVYSTPYQRTRLTASPTAEQKDLPILEYKPGNETAFIEHLQKVHQGETLLIIGHSNTVPRLANAAAGKKLFPDLEDSIYDNLFIAVFAEKGPAAVYRLRFGDPSNK